MKPVLLSTAYLPPIAWVALSMQGPIILEAHEHYEKQTVRNRATIAGANGTMHLVIPVQHEGLQRSAITEVRIAEDPAWRRIHWKSIASAYGNAPYFDYYADELHAVFLKDEKMLFQWNLHLLECICKLLRLDFQPGLTTAYEAESSAYTDMRHAFSWPQTNLPYQQVFMPRLPFFPGLSIIDLLFNKGNQSVDYLQLLIKSS